MILIWLLIVLLASDVKVTFEPPINGKSKGCVIADQNLSLGVYWYCVNTGAK